MIFCSQVAASCRLADEDVAANDVLVYFLNLDTATFPSLTELEKNINPYPKQKSQN